MQNILTITDKYLQQQTINARELWVFLENKRQFADWIKDRLKDFEENIDYIRISQIRETSKGATTLIEYYITQYTAEHIAMIERNDKGKQVRNFFRQTRDKLNMIHNQVPQIDSKFLLQIAQEMQKKELLIEEQKQTIDIQDNTIDQISNTQETYSITEASKKLNLKICQLTQYLIDKKWIRYLLDSYKTKKLYSTSYATQSNFGIDKTVFNKKLNSYFHQFRITSHGMNYLIKKRNNIDN